MRAFIFIVILLSVLGVASYVQYHDSITKAKHECYKIVVDKPVHEIKELCGK